MNNELLPTDTTQALGRRGLLRIGGLTALTAVAVAACGTTEAGTVGRIGEGATTPKLDDPIVNDGVLLRTMAGIETSIAAAYAHIVKSGLLAAKSATLPDLGDHSDLVTIFQAHHTEAATSFNAMAVEAGAEAWTCGNTRLDEAYLAPIFERVEHGVAATDTALAIPASDDATRDYINLVHTLESLSASSCQSLVQAATTPAIRATSMQWGVRSARQAALIALRINPAGYTPGSTDAAPAPDPATTTAAAQDAAPPTTAIPLPVAVPAQFGLLSPTTYVGGAGDENGVRLKLSFETPSLNSLAYPFDSCP